MAELTGAEIQKRQQIIENIKKALSDPETECFIFYHMNSGKKYVNTNGFFNARILNVFKKHLNSMVLECHLNNLP